MRDGYYTQSMSWSLSPSWFLFHNATTLSHCSPIMVPSSRLWCRHKLYTLDWAVYFGIARLGDKWISFFSNYSAYSLQPQESDSYRVCLKCLVHNNDNVVYLEVWRQGMKKWQINVEFPDNALLILNSWNFGSINHFIVVYTLISHEDKDC